MWDLPRPRLKPVFPALAGEFLTTAPLGKSLTLFFVNTFSVLSVSLSPRKGHVSTQDDDHLQSRERSLIRTQPDWHPDSQTSSCLNCEKKNFCCLSHAIYGILLWHPELTKTGGIINLLRMRKIFWVSCFTYMRMNSPKCTLFYQIYFISHQIPIKAPIG